MRRRERPRSEQKQRPIPERRRESRQVSIRTEQTSHQDILKLVVHIGSGIRNIEVTQEDLSTVVDRVSALLEAWNSGEYQQKNASLGHLAGRSAINEYPTTIYIPVANKTVTSFPSGPAPITHQPTIDIHLHTIEELQAFDQGLAAFRW